MTEQELYTGLSADLGDEAIQRTTKENTKKGYDTTGYGYQYIVDRFNEVCGIFGWEKSYVISNVENGSYKSGAPFYSVTADVTIKIKCGDMVRSETMPGGHVSTTLFDAEKGAVTNGIKKCAAMFGVGAAAFRGDIDDDGEYPDSQNNIANIDSIKNSAKKDFGDIECTINYNGYFGRKMSSLTKEEYVDYYNFLNCPDSGVNVSEKFLKAMFDYGVDKHGWKRPDGQRQSKK